MDVKSLNRSAESGYSWNPSSRKRRPARGPVAGDQRRHVVTDKATVNAAMRANGLAKRIFDIIAALSGLIVLTPLLATVALLIFLQDGGSPFYGHRRVGRQGRTFLCWKFRSMIRNGDAVLQQYLASNPEAELEWREVQKLKRDPRVTPLGTFIRKTSIDELPQLWNVLCGEMSIIGPRPITRAELDRYGKDRRYYLLVRPGITGLWQVSGRSTTTYERRIELDRSYLCHWSFQQEALILLKTVPAVLKSEGAN